VVGRAGRGEPANHQEVHTHHAEEKKKKKKKKKESPGSSPTKRKGGKGNTADAKKRAAGTPLIERKKARSLRGGRLRAPFV